MDVTPALLAEARRRFSMWDQRILALPPTVRSVFCGDFARHSASTAVREWHWVENNPVEKIQKPRVRNERNRYLSDDERKALLISGYVSKAQIHICISLLPLH